MNIFDKISNEILLIKQKN